MERQGIRSDLAVEAHELWAQSAGETTRLSGVRARTEQRAGCTMQRVEILDAAGAAALGKPQGVYLTLEVAGRREDRAAESAAIAAAVEELTADWGEGLVLVAGLGNRHVTPDAIGAYAVSATIVTRHLGRCLPELFGDFRPVAAVTPGVLGDTGLESCELLEALTQKLHPVGVVVIDALAARESARLCRTVQLTDTGIVPGSGVGNHRHAISRESLGVPVLAAGIPTVVEASRPADAPEGAGEGGGLFLTPRWIDSAARTLGRLLGLGVSRGLLAPLSLEEAESFLS